MILTSIVRMQSSRRPILAAQVIWGVLWFASGELLPVMPKPLLAQVASDDLEFEQEKPPPQSNEDDSVDPVASELSQHDLFSSRIRAEVNSDQDAVFSIDRNDDIEPPESTECGVGCRRDCQCEDCCTPLWPNASATRPWNLTLLLAYEYDSNVRLFPQFIGLGSDVRKFDSRMLIALFADVRLIEEADCNLGLIGSTFSTWQFELNNLNAQDYMAGAYSNTATGDALYSLRYEFHQALLGDSPLYQQHRLTPSTSYLGFDWGHTTVYYEFEHSDFDLPALIPAQIQSGVVNAIGFTQAVYTNGGEGRIYFGYRFEIANTVGSDFDRRTNMVTARVEQPLGSNCILDAEARQFWDDYDSPNSLDFFDRSRSDSRLEIRSGLQRNFPNHWSFRLDYTFVSSNSNVENLFGVNFYEYDRHVVSSQLIYNF